MRINDVISIVSPRMVELFSKLFKRKSQPTNEGTMLDGGNWTKTFSVQLSNMEESPTYELKKTLTVGSEVGDIVVSDPSISPRHCSFTLQDDVVSLIDHGSVGGTFVNNKKIPSGRYVVLQESDLILAGELQLKIVSHTKKSRIEKEVELDIAPEKVVLADVSKSAHKTKSKEATSAKIKAPRGYATNALVRVFSVAADLLIAYSLFVVMNPFDEYREFINDIPHLVGDALGVDWKSFWEAILQDYDFLGTLLQDVAAFTSIAAVGSVILNFFVIRLFSTLLLGVSISEFMMGIRSQGNGVWARIGGFIRVMIGMFTWPLLIFDIPAILSRRTFKELMTFTHTYLLSGFYAAIGIVIYLPMLLALVIFSPLIQGLEAPQAHIVDDKLDQRIKVARTETNETAPGVESIPAEVSEVVSEIRDQGRFMKFELSYDPNKVSFFPSFKFQGIGKKMTYRPELVAYHKDLQRIVKIEVFKNFNFKELLHLGMSGNYFLFERFPELYNFVFSSDETNAVFRAKMNETTLRNFADEFINFTKLSFELSLENSFDFMMEVTPLIKSPLDYKASLLGLLEYKDFDSINYLRIGSSYFLKFSYLKQKPFDLIIPILPHSQGSVYRIEYDKKDDVNTLSNQFYKFTLEKSGWMPSDAAENVAETMSPMQIIDFLSGIDLKDPKISSEKAQAIYGHYFEKSAEVLRSDDPLIYEAWKPAVDAIFKIIETINELSPSIVSESNPETPSAESAPAEPTEADSRQKLFQNFKDLKNAIDQKDRTYLGIENSKV